MTEEEARERCAYWQRVLRLQDWEIEVNVARAYHMRLDGLAECHWQIKKRMAVINLQDPIDFDPGWLGDRDMELSLVHELLHLHLAPWSPQEGTEDDVFEEQAIHAMSKAFVELERRDELEDDADPDDGQAKED